MVDSLPTRWLNVSHHSAQHIAERYLYCGYGSNLWLQQIGERCPQADTYGRGRLRGARLAFAKVATIIADENVDTLVGIYTLTASDIETLDKREGLGRSYDRYLVTPEVDDGNAVRCFTYIRRDATPGAPTDEYFAKLTAGYRDWGFPDRRLRRARERAIKDEAALPKKPANDYWNFEPWGNGPSRPPRHPAPKSANRTSLVTGRNLDRDREPLLKRSANQEAVSRGMKIHWANRREAAAKRDAEPRLFERDETIGKYLERHERDPGIAEQITRDGGQTTFHNRDTGEHWAKSGGVWRRVKQ